MSFAYRAVVYQKKLLQNLATWIDAAVAFATQKSFDPNVFMSARLAPDQFTFARQVQTACDHAKFTASRLAGKQPPKHPDVEQTIDELKARIATVIAYLDGFSERDFVDAETRPVVLQFVEGKTLAGIDYLVEFAQPNFYFHLVTAYAILRHNGVELGKRDFLAPLSFR